MLLGPADVHPHQHLGPVGGVHPTGSGTDVDQRFPLVVLTGEQGADLHRSDVLLKLLELGVGLDQGFGTACSILFGGELVEHRQIVEPTAQLLDATQLALRVRQLTGDLLRARLVVPQVRVGGVLLELFDTTAKRLDIENPLHRGERGVEGGDIGLTVRIHGSSGYSLRDRHGVSVTCAGMPGLAVATI